LTRAQMASLVGRALGLWPSVSEIHFTDVPYTHWAFRDIETLFDNRLLGPFGIKPLWPQAGGYLAKRDSGFAKAQPFGQFLPDEPVTWKEFGEMLRQFGRQSASGRPAEARVTRGEACIALAPL